MSQPAPFDFDKFCKIAGMLTSDQKEERDSASLMTGRMLAASRLTWSHVLTRPVVETPVPPARPTPAPEHAAENARNSRARPAGKIHAKHMMRERIPANIDGRIGLVHRFNINLPGEPLTLIVTLTRLDRHPETVSGSTAGDPFTTIFGPLVVIDPGSVQRILANPMGTFRGTCSQPGSDGHPSGINFPVFLAVA